MVAMDDETEYVPERNWKDRASPIFFMPGVPQDILYEYLAVKKRFGIDVANLIIFAYRSWGKRVAKNLANRILQHDSFEDVMKFLESKISMFDKKSKKILSGLIYSFKYSYYFDSLLSILNKHANTCPGARDIAINIFHYLASRGVFYNPECIVEYAFVKAGCSNNVKAKCRSVAKNIDAYCRDIIG